MTEGRTPPREEAATERPDTWERRRRLAELFDDVLPDTTRDEREGDEAGTGRRTGDDWLREQVPPHHGT